MAMKKPEDKLEKTEPRREAPKKKLGEPGVSDVAVPKVEAPAPKATPKETKTDDKPKPKPKKKAPAFKSKSVVKDEPVKSLPKVTLDVYLLAKGIKPDQTAGFRRWMKGRKVRRQTMPEWDATWTEFHDRPVTSRR